MSDHWHRTHAAPRPGSFSFPVVTAAGTGVRSGTSTVWMAPQTYFLAATLAALLAFGAGGMALGGPASTIAACAAILLFGLPHGALDLEIIKRYSLAIRQETAPAEEVLAVLDATRAAVAAALAAQARPAAPRAARAARAARPRPAP